MRKNLAIDDEAANLAALFFNQNSSIDEIEPSMEAISVNDCLHICHKALFEKNMTVDELNFLLKFFEGIK